jgi:hypothetical protein
MYPVLMRLERKGCLTPQEKQHLWQGLETLEHHNLLHPSYESDPFERGVMDSECALPMPFPLHE